MQSLHPQYKEPVAVIGMACRFPGDASSPQKFWQLLEQGGDAITPVPADRWDMSLYADVIPDHGGFIRQVDQFDAPFFQVSPKEATMLDPQQRLLLEVTWEALEHAGINPASLRGSDTGVFVGIFSNDYQMLQVKRDDPHLYISTGASAATASGRISYFLGLHGPAVSIDTASSSSLVALHQAVVSLQTGECHMTLAAGVNLILAPDLSIAFARAGMLSPDGRSKGFDASANGYVRGEGCGVVLLKRLSDAVRDGDTILALVRGTAVNQDGASQGLTVPSALSQEAVIRKALAVAGLQPQDVSYVEAHGSGTPVGDPVEAGALQAVYGAGRQSPWTVGSVKTNIGHLEAAAGIAGVIKTVLMLQHRQIPPHLHFRSLNPALAGLQATVPTRLQPWHCAQGPRRAAVSSFGFSGTNAHAILEEAPADLQFARYALRVTRPPAYENGLGWGVTRALQAGTGQPAPLHEVGVPRHHLVTLSAQGQPALQALAQRYLDYLTENPKVDLADLAYTTQVGRAQFAHRLTAVAADPAELRDQLQAFVEGETAPGLAGDPEFALNSRPEGSRKIAFLFTGGGAQSINMGRELYATQPLFRQILDECDQLLRAHPEFGPKFGPESGPVGLKLLEVLYPASPANAQEAEALRHRGTADGEGINSKLIDEMAYMQPALFAIEYALAKLWEAWGIRPDIVMGHSAGEYAAACVAGVFSFEDGLNLIATRGRLMGSTAAGAMVALEAPEEMLDEALDKTISRAIAPWADRVSVGVVNSRRNVVISGDAAAIEQILATLPGTRQDAPLGAGPEIKATRLKITCASHSPLMESILDPFEEAARQVTFASPRIPFVSNVTGAVESERITTSAYWREHLRATVRFAEGVQTLAAEGATVYVEIGPKPTLLGMAQHCLSVSADGPEIAHERAVFLPSLRPGQGDWQQMLASLGELFVRGSDVDWGGVWEERASQRQRLALPTYPFQRERFWVSTLPATRASAMLLDGSEPMGHGRHDGEYADAHDEAARIAGEGAASSLFPGAGSPAGASVNDPYQLPDGSQRMSYEVGRHSPAYLDHYRIFGQAVLSTGFYLETALIISREILNVDQLSLENCVLEQVLPLPEEPGAKLTMQAVLLPPEDGQYEVQIFSLAPPLWRRHLRSALRNLEGTVAPPVNLAALRSQCPVELPVERFYAQTTTRQIVYRAPSARGFGGKEAAGDMVEAAPGDAVPGEAAHYEAQSHYEILQELWRGEECALGRLQLPAALSAEAEVSGLHSLLIEGGVQVALAAFPALLEGETYLPVTVARVTLYGTAGTGLWAYACRQPSASGPGMSGEALADAVITMNVTLLDNVGVVAQFDGMTFKQATPASLFRRALLPGSPPQERDSRPQGSRAQRLPAPSAPVNPGQKAGQARLLEQLAAAPEDQRSALLAAFVQKQVRQVLGVRAEQTLPLERPLKELGLDSLMTTDLKNRLERECKIIIPAEQILRAGASVQSLSSMILGRLSLATPPQPSPDWGGSERLHPRPGGASAPQVGEGDARGEGSHAPLGAIPGPQASAEADVEDFTAAAAEVPQIHAVVTEQIGRKVKIEDRWIFDFASCNYLGIDLEPEIMEAIPPALQKWGVHPSWTRAVASPGIYEDLEKALAELVGAPSTLVFPAVTLLHAGVIPLLAGSDGMIFKDISAHRSIIEACRLAQTNGAEYLDFRHNDPVDLEAKLARYPLERTKIIAIDGVYSMSGEYPPLPEFARLAKQYNAWVYLDDAHGIGVIGEAPSPEMPYGHRGNGIVRYFGLDYVQDRLIYVAGLSKSFSSFGAFITCHDQAMKDLFRSASTFIFSGPSPVASLASALAGIQLNQREGERWRSQVYELTYRLIDGARRLGYEVINDNYFPIVCVVIGKTRDVIEACKILWEYGILITPALYPIVPKDKGLLRFSITAANTVEEIDRSLEALAAVRARLLHDPTRAPEGLPLPSLGRGHGEPVHGEPTPVAEEAK